MDNKVLGRFCKVLMPGFETNLNVPIQFVRTLNNVDLNTTWALLKSCKGSRSVRVERGNDGLLRFSGEGWERYVADHELKVHDFVVFEHRGLLHFNTTVFDETCCEKDFETENDYSSEDLDTFPEREENPQFEKIISQHNMNGGFMNIPIEFARANGLMSNASVTLRIDTGGSWLVTLLVAGVNDTRPARQIRVYLSGLIGFIRGNDLKVGDKCVFKIDGSSRISNAVVMDVVIVRRR